MFRRLPTIRILAIVLFVFSTLGTPAVFAHPTRAAAPDSHYTVAWVNLYKFPLPQPACAGGGIASQYFGGDDCGFGVFTISPADPNISIVINFIDQNGSTFHSEAAVYDSLDNEYQVDITPAAAWSTGNVTLNAVVQAPHSGDGATAMYLNFLQITANLNQSTYNAGDPVIVSGNTYRRSGINLAPVDTPVNAAMTVTVIDPDSQATVLTQTTTASTTDGSWSVTFSGASTAGLGSKNYIVQADGSWTDATVLSGPPTWSGRVRAVAPFGAVAADLAFRADPTAADGTVHAGETTLYVLEARNGTATAATSAVVTAVLPTGAVFLPASTIPAPTSGSGSTGDPLTWNLGGIAPGSDQRIYLYARAKEEAEDYTIVWQPLNLRAGIAYVHGAMGSKSAAVTTLGPRVVPEGEVGKSVRNGPRPFPVALVDYQDIKHAASHPGAYFADQIFPVVIERYLEMSFGQLLPVPVLPSVGGGDVRYDQTSGATYRWSTLQPNGFCSGTTTAGATGNPADPNGPPAGATYRISSDYYQLPGTQGYYGSDSTGSNYVGALTGVGALVNVDNGCNPPGAIAYDAATLMDPDVDYNDFDSDRNGWVDFFELVYAGYPENVIGQAGVNNIWPHSSSLEYYYPGGYVSHDQLRNHQDQPMYWADPAQTVMTTTVTADPIYVKVGPYNVNAEYSGETTFSHEYGHSLGLPDNYSLGSRDTMNDWDLMASGEGHMSTWDKQELGWIVPSLITARQVVTGQSELKIDTQRIDWLDSRGVEYTLSGPEIHNADVRKVNLPSVQLFDPSIIPSGAWVYYSQAGNDFGYPGHIFDIAFDANLTAGASSLELDFSSWYEIEVDYDYGYVQVSTDAGQTWTNLPSLEGTTRNTNPNGNNQGNGITCVSGAQNDPTCGAVSYPDPVFITDRYDLSAYSGQDFILRWAYSTDPGLALRGWVVDDIQLIADGSVVFSDDAEDPLVSNDDNHVYNGWLRSNGSGTAEHAYWISVRDRTGFDAATSFQPGVEMEYANEAHGYGNVGVDNPPALTVVDSVPQPGSDTPNLDDAAWRPFPSDPGNPNANNRDLFTDCDVSTYANGPRHIDNYTDLSPDNSDPNQYWHFDFQRLNMLVTGISGQGSGSMSANITYQGAVDVLTITDIASRWNTTAANPDPDNDPATPNYARRYDLDGDQDIDVRDIMLLAAQFGRPCA